MSSLTHRSVSLTPEQSAWLAEKLPARFDWPWVGDCQFGYRLIKDDHLGISVTYDPTTSKYAIRVKQ